MNKVEDQIRVLESGHIKLFNDFRERVQTQQSNYEREIKKKTAQTISAG